MKKFVTVLTALALICSITACSSGGSVTINSSDREDVVNGTDMVEPDYAPTSPAPSDSSTSHAPSTSEPADTEAPNTTAPSTTSPATTMVPHSEDIKPTAPADEWDSYDDFFFDVEAEVATEGLWDGGMADVETWIEPPYYDEPVIQPEAGLLTGGEWNDNDHWHDWVSLYQTHEDWATYRDIWHTDYTECRFEVKITSKGKPVEGAIVHCDLMSAVTDNSGTAYLFFNAQDNENIRRTDSVRMLTVEYDGIEESIMDWEYVNNGDVIEYELKADISRPENSLDLMLMVDTTGSMMDELMYLQEELKDVITRIQKDNGNIPIRVSVNFYRDEGDDYVVRAFPFTDDINSAVEDIASQDASGGGDTPEAVHTALDNALNDHEWNESSTKLMFFVLDAPPHDDEQIIDEVKKLTLQSAKMGVRIIPVASSGIDKSTEYLLRTMAFTTGGTYTFLTDDSGIGGSHIEPTIGDYTVEKLNDMMVRIVNNYLNDVEQAPVAIERTQPEISFDNMLMSIDVTFNDPTCYSILTAMEDGTLYQTTYLGHNSGEFFTRFHTCDESAFELSTTENVGTLDINALAKLKEYIGKIDTTSEYYDYIRDNDGITNEVEEPFHITVYSYHTVNGAIEPFHITSHAGSNIYYETTDENALAAYKLLQENELVLEWWTDVQ